MRASLLGRLVAHPTIAFASWRRRAHLSRLGRGSSPTRYYPRRREQAWPPTVGSLRAESSRFRFPSGGGLSARRARRASLPLGISRARRP